jgi:hypothetical protein
MTRILPAIFSAGTILNFEMRTVQMWTYYYVSIKNLSGRFLTSQRRPVQAQGDDDAGPVQIPDPGRQQRQLGPGPGGDGARACLEKNDGRRDGGRWPEGTRRGPGAY